MKDGKSINESNKYISKIKREVWKKDEKKQI